MKTTDHLIKMQTWLCARPHQAGLFFLAVAALAGATIGRVPFEGGLEIMLPENSEARQSILFLRDADFADKVAFAVSLHSSQAETRRLLEQLDRLAAHFESSPLVERVMRPPDGREMLQTLNFFLDRFDELATAEDRARYRERLQTEQIEQRMRQIYLQMLKPEGSMMQDIIRRDPLGVSAAILQRIRRLSQAFGYRVGVRDGHFLHPDGRRGLLLLETGIPMTDTVGSRQLVDFLTATKAQIPTEFAAEFVCGHQRSVSNERLLRRDIRLTASLASLGFLLLFLAVFRDFRAGAIFLIPLVSILVSIHLSAWLMGRLSYLVVGFGAVMAGIAVDYGIHVYVSWRRSGGDLAALRQIMRPLVLSGCTTLSVFLAFFASAVPGYRQLAVFAVISIGLAIGGAVLLLPPILGRRTAGSRPPLPDQAKGQAGGRLWALLFWGALPLAAGLASQVGLDTELTRLDGTEPAILAAEQEFREQWSEQDEEHALAVVAGSTREQAAARNDLLWQRLGDSLPEGDLINLAAVWPGPAQRARNQIGWREFWTAERIARAREAIREAGQPYGFTASAFDPFFDLLRRQTTPTTPEEGAGNPVLQQLEARFIQVSEDRVHYISYFPDRPAASAAVQAAIDDIPEAFTVSGRRIGEALAESTTREALLVSGLALCLILTVVFGLMRNLRMSLAALLPAATGILWLLAIMRATGLTINIANMIAGIVVLGLCIDYGIFMVHGWRHGAAVLAATRQAVTLSAATTVMGTGVLLFARHPALFSIGLTLTVGVIAGFLAAMLGVPATCRWLGIPAVHTPEQEAGAA